MPVAKTCCTPRSCCPQEWLPKAPEWTRDRAELWNAAERAETRRNARVAREWQVGLPSELPAAQRLSLVRTFSQEIADRYNIAVDLAVHEPRPGSDPRNFHAHILGTTREMTVQGLGAKTGIDMPLAERLRRGLPSVPEEFRAIRERWADLTNAALQAAHIDARVDHRTLRAQGIDREPQPRLPVAALKIERAGGLSYVAERLRDEHRTRLAVRAQGDEAAPAANTQASPLEDVRRAAREGWLRMRGEFQGRKPAVRGDQALERGVDDDYSP